MIFFYNAQGNAINVVPEPVYQGSNKANTIYVVAPFPSNVQVLAHFLLPNGEILQPVYAPNKNGLTLLDTLNINDSSVGVWGVQLTKVMTAYAGIVSVQFEFISYDQEITTKTVMFPVSKGVPPSVPLDTTAETTLQEILSYISVILETLDTVSRGTPLVSNETFVLDVTHESIVVGYNALLPLSSFDRTPVQGEKFWGICKTNDNYAYSFVAVVMSVDNENSVVEVDFTKVILLYDADFYINATNKLNKLIFDGNGDKFLADDGEYKKIVGGGTTVTVNGVAVETFDADTKMDAVTNTKDNVVLLGLPSGSASAPSKEVQKYDATSAARNNSLCIRSAAGYVRAKTPTTGNADDLTNREYVDEKTGLHQHQITLSHWVYINDEIGLVEMDMWQLYPIMTRSTAINTTEELANELQNVVLSGYFFEDACTVMIDEDKHLRPVVTFRGTEDYGDITENNRTQGQESYWIISDSAIKIGA